MSLPTSASVSSSSGAQGGQSSGGNVTFNKGTSTGGLIMSVGALVIGFVILKKFIKF